MSRNKFKREAVNLHRQHGRKIEVVSKVETNNEAGTFLKALHPSVPDIHVEDIS